MSSYLRNSMLPLGWKLISSGAGGRGAPSLRTQVRSGRGSPVTRQLTTPPVLLVKVRLGGRGRSSSGPYESAHSTASGPQQLLYTVAQMRTVYCTGLVHSQRSISTKNCTWTPQHYLQSKTAQHQYTVQHEHTGKPLDTTALIHSSTA